MTVRNKNEKFLQAYIHTKFKTNVSKDEWKNKTPNTIPNDSEYIDKIIKQKWMQLRSHVIWSNKTIRNKNKEKYNLYKWKSL